MVIDITNSPNRLVREVGRFREFGDEKRVKKFVRHTWVGAGVAELQCERNWPQSTKAWHGAPPVHQNQALVN